MVGVPRSNGCAICRRRSVKCDELRPACSQCKRGGRKCPGYTKTLKFIDEGTNFRAKLTDPLTIPQSNLISPHPSNISLQRLQIVANFVQDLIPRGPNSIRHSHIGGWLWLVPSIMRQNQTLDFAAEALASMYFAKKPGPAERTGAALVHSSESYGRAIRRLSGALQSREQCFSSEVLCASLLLVHYERFSSLKGQSWLSHARGVSHLIKARGPNRHKSGVDRAMLLASRGYIISEALMTNQDCFLEHPRWRSVQLVDHTFEALSTDCALYHEGLNLFAQIPSIVRKTRALTYPVVDTHADVQTLQSTASQLRSNMLDWYIRAGIVSKRCLRFLSNESTKELAYYHYNTSTTASFAVNYCAYLILVNKALDLLSGFCSHEDANKDLAMEISLSATYCFDTGFCGAQALMQALPIALTAVPRGHPTYEDLRKWMRRLDESEMAIKWNAEFSGKL